MLSAAAVSGATAHFVENKRLEGRSSTARRRCTRNMVHWAGDTGARKRHPMLPLVNAIVPEPPFLVYVVSCIYSPSISLPLDFR